MDQGNGDIASLFFDDKDGPDAQNALRLAAALRGQTALGQLGQLTGSKLLSNVGTGMLQGVSDQNALIAKAGSQIRQQGLQLSMAKQEQDAAARRQQESDRAAMQRTQAGIDAGKFTAPQGLGAILNSKTGETMPITTGPGGDGYTPKQLNEMAKDLEHHLSTNSGRGNLNVEQQKRLNASDRIKAIAMNPDGSPKDLNPGTAVEMAMMMGQLAGGNSPTQHTIESMVPSGIGMDVAKMGQWLTNEPKGAGQQAFVQLAINQAKREEETIRPQMLAAQLQNLPRYAPMRKHSPQVLDSMLKAAGIDPSSLDENLLPLAKAAQAGLAPDKAARLAELRKLRDSGQLK